MRFFRALLYCYPAAFRHEYGGQMQLMFAEQLRQCRGRVQRARLWLGAAMDAITIAPKEHGHVMLEDLRYALRIMSANRVFTAVAILSLALGIGANTAIFSLWNGVLHASLPGVRQPEELVMLSDPGMEGSWHGRWIGRIDGNRAWLTYQEFEQIRDHATTLSNVMASQSSLGRWQVQSESGEWEQARGRLVSGGYFQALGVKPEIGQLFSAAYDNAELPQAVISYSYWQRRFGGRPEAVGTTLKMRKTALTIIGVAARDFIGETSGQQPDLWAPLRMQMLVMPGEDRLHDAALSKDMWLHVFARLRPGVTAAQAEAEANAIFQAGLESFYGKFESEEQRREFLDQHLGIHSGARGASATRHTFSESLTALLVAVGVLLLIACANLANLFLARGSVRRPEIALRLSLGASRGRLLRQLITESMALGIAGFVAGLALAYVLYGVLVRIIGETDRSFRMDFAWNPILFVYALGITIVAVLLFGVLPAWEVTKADAGESLKEESRSATGSLRPMRWGRALVSLQLALSLPLLVSAGLLARTLYNLQRVNLGYSSERLVEIWTDPREAGLEGARRDNWIRELRGELQRVPGVTAVTYSASGIFSGGGGAVPVEVEGYAGKERGTAVDILGPGYYETLGIPMVQGRRFLDSDYGIEPKVCIINQAFAERYFDRRNPIGLHVTTVLDDNSRTSYQVVGVARNARTANLREAVLPEFFVPSSQPPFGGGDYALLIRTAGSPSISLQELRKAIKRVDASVPIEEVRTIEELIAPMTAQDRSVSQIATIFGAAALVLAAIGLYGVLAYGVARRRMEIAIRMALGAEPVHVIAMILRETTALVLTGLVLGAGLAYFASRLITSRLFGIAPHDPLTLSTAVGVLILVAFLAAYVPARRASRLDPIAALRRQ